MRILAIAVCVVSMWGSGAGAQCTLPGNFTNAATVVEDSLVVTLATERSLYEPGEVVNFYMIVRNDRSTTFSINWGIDPQDGIFVMADSCASYSQGDCFDNAVYVWPQILYYYSAGTTLAPGECRVWQRQWDTAVYPAPPDSYVIQGGMFEPSGDASIGQFRVPTTGVFLQLVIDRPVEVRRSTWGHVKALYR